MANLDFNSSNSGAGLSDLATNGKNLVVAVNSLNTTLAQTFPRISGTFTLAAAATTTVLDTNVTSTSIIMLTPTNAAAGTLQGSAKCLYLSARTSGASFTVATASAVAAAGTETFQYSLWNPS